MDGLDLLQRQHRQVEEAFAAYEELGPGDEARRAKLVRQVTADLSVHAAIEEQALYPLVRLALPRMGDEIRDDLSQHQDVKERLARLERLDATDEEFDAVFREVMEHVREHVEDEEEHLFPTLRQTFTRGQLVDLGVALEALAALSPTRPHPELPNQPPGNVLLGPAAAIMDRMFEVARNYGPLGRSG